MLDSSAFKVIVRDNFAPFLRSYGFQGSGFNYRRITKNHYVHALTIQGNKYGGSCCVEMGVHIDGLPTIIGEMKAPHKIQPYDCDIRKRLSPKSSDYWWTYGEDEKEALESIGWMKQVFEIHGLGFFDKFIDFPEPILSIEMVDIKSRSKKYQELFKGLYINEDRAALLLARLNLLLGNEEKAKHYANWGINHGSNSKVLTEAFESLKNGQLV